MNRVFVVHHNPNSGRYRYAGDPQNAVASAQALLDGGEGRWVAGNCRRLMRIGDLLLFKFGGARLQDEPGIYAAARVTRAPSEDRHGRWVFRYQPLAAVTRQLMKSPIVGGTLARIVPRSFGASIQVVQPRGRSVLTGLLPKEAIAPGVTRGLLVLKEPLDQILAGTKTWESESTHFTLQGALVL